jgi:nucleotide-binding universal stress UspA family protein
MAGTKGNIVPTAPGGFPNRWANVSNVRGDVYVDVPYFYDYDLIDDHLRERVKAAVREIRSRDRNALDELVAIGKQLTLMKHLLRGQFTEWVQTEFGYGTTIARQLMAVADRFGNQMTLSAALNPSTMRLLSSSSLSDEKVEEITARAEAEGRKVTVKEVEEEIRVGSYKRHTITRTQKPLHVDFVFRVDSPGEEIEGSGSVLDAAAAAGQEQGASRVQEPSIDVNMRKNKGPIDAPARPRVSVELDAYLCGKLIGLLRGGVWAAYFTADEQDALIEQLEGG